MTTNFHYIANMIDINEGNTNNYLVHGFFTMLGAAILFTLSLTVLSALLYVALAAAVFGVLLFSATNGLQIDTANNKYRAYGKIGTVKFGPWGSFETPVRAVLILHAENQQLNSAPLIGKAASVNSKVVTYDIKLFDTLDTTYVLYDFLDYKNAKKALKGLQEAYDITVVNKVAEKLAENRQRRR